MSNGRSLNLSNEPRPLNQSELLELKLLRTEVGILREEIENYKELLRQYKVTDNTKTGRIFNIAWSLTRKEQVFLWHILDFSLKGKVITKEQLYSRMYPVQDDNSPTLRILDVWKHRINKQLYDILNIKDVILNDWGNGWYVKKEVALEMDKFVIRENARFHESQEN